MIKNNDRKDRKKIINYVVDLITYTKKSKLRFEEFVILQNKVLSILVNLLK